MFATSDGNVTDASGCVHAATYDQAVAMCAADGARLCTVEEMEAGCTMGTGCDHDVDMIWTSEPCGTLFPPLPRSLL